MRRRFQRQFIIARSVAVVTPKTFRLTTFPFVSGSAANLVTFIFLDSPYEIYLLQFCRVQTSMPGNFLNLIHFHLLLLSLSVICTVSLFVMGYRKVNGIILSDNGLLSRATEKIIEHHTFAAVFAASKSLQLC
jgi:hypothetical protein